MGSVPFKQIISDFVLNNQEAVLTVLGKATALIAILILSFIAIKFGSIAIKKFFMGQKKLSVKKSDTLLALSVSIFKYTIYFITIVTILKNVFGIDATTIITAAGVGGLAIGFGAQSLVKDVITGFFILLENQFAVGDNISIDAMTGDVEEIGLRITKLRNDKGGLHIIPNSAIVKVTNHTMTESLFHDEPAQKTKNKK